MCRASSPVNPANVSSARTPSSGPQHSRWPLPERGGQRSSDQQRHHVGVRQGQLAEVARDGAQLGGPVRVCFVHRELREHDLGDAVEHCGLVGDVAVEHHRISAQCVAEAAHGQSVHTVAVDDRQRGLQDHRPGELTVVFGRPRRRTAHRRQRPRRARSAVSSSPPHFPSASSQSLAPQVNTRSDGVGQHCVYTVDKSVHGACTGLLVPESEAST